jgi:hypothetical protein
MSAKKTASFKLSAWANPSSRMIHLASPEAGIISTVSNDPKSKRFHPNLFMKLRRVLKAQGKWPAEM